MENINNEYAELIYNMDNFYPSYKCSKCYGKPMFAADDVERGKVKVCPYCGSKIRIRKKFSKQSISVMKAAKTKYAVFGGDVIYFQNKIGISVFCVPSYMIPEMEKGDVIEI